MANRGWVFLGFLVSLVLAAYVLAAEVNPSLPTGKVTIAGRVKLTVELARTVDEQVRGLSGRAGLKAGSGMLFVYDHPHPISIWMKDMRFSLDIIWIQAGRIVAIEKHAPPLTSAGPERVYTVTADSVLEVPAGFTEREKIRLGDSVQAVLP